MVYLLIVVLSIGLWFVFVGFAKLIDLSNKNKPWYKEIQKRIEEEN
ncbi:MAG: hypothetical protein IJ675_00915 [Pseudobutyrivibrio sp.]|nr:hypothetical protein [Pseudobutyrivibrio sp.]